MQITVDNASNFGPGTRFEMNYGAMYAPCQAIVTRVEIVPSSKFFPAMARLWAKVKDHDGGESETTIQHIVTSDDASPIGAHLIEAVPIAHKSKSPWA